MRKNFEVQTRVFHIDRPDLYGTVTDISRGISGSTHTIRWDDLERSKHVGDVLREVKPSAAVFRVNDRVKFRHNGKVGEVLSILRDGRVAVQYDVSDGWAAEEANNLTLLHSPAAKAEEGPHPMQAAIDAIEEERRVIKLRVAADQQRLGELSKAKELLARG